LLALYGALSLIDENTPRWKSLFKKWKSKFDKAVKILRLRKARFSIDTDTAKKLARFHLQTKRAKGFKKITFVSALRHSANNIPLVEDVTNLKKPKKDKKFLENVEACDLAFSRHVFCVEADFRGYTIIIEGDGTCSYLREIK
jgi:hypothetical protein